MESTLEGPATLEALMMEYDNPPQHLRKKPVTISRHQQSEDNHSSRVEPRKSQQPIPGELKDGAGVGVGKGRPAGGGKRSSSKDDLELISLHPEMEVAALGDDALEEDVGGAGGAGGAVSMAPGEAGGSPAPSPGRQGQEEAEAVDGSDTGDIMSSRESELLTDGEGDGDPTTESNAEEGEEEEPEMTKEEKKALSDAVCEGNIDLLDDLLDLPGADINMEWFGENLLMAAIRNDEPEMATFLLDNGINQNYEAARLHMKNHTTGEFEWYTISCRQMAYDYGMMDVVSIIDERNNNKWPFIRDPPRTPRIKRPLADKLREKHEAAEAERKRREEMHQRYKRRSSIQEVTSEDTSSRDNASVTSHTSYNSSFCFSDGNSVRGDRKRKQSKADPMSPLLAEEEPSSSRGKAEDGTSLPEGEEGEEEEEEETGPFFVPLGPTHMFPYPAEDEPVISVPHHHYRANRTFISRRDSNTQKIRSSLSVAGSGTATPVDRSPSVGSYRAESLLWTPSVTPSHEPSMAATRPNGRHTSLSTRLMSPWKDDDPEVVAAFQKRSKSASTVGGVVRVGGNSGGLPGRIRSSRPLFPVLNAMPQLTGVPPGGMSPRRDNFMTPARSSATDIVNPRLTGLTARHTSHHVMSRQELGARHSTKPRTKETGTGEGEDTDVLTSQQGVPLPPHTSMTSHKDAALIESDSRTPSGRSRPPRSHSPAGYLRAFSAGRRQPAPVIHIVVPPT